MKKKKSLAEIICAAMLIAIALVAIYGVSGSQVIVGANVTNVPPTIEKLCIYPDDDPLEDGYQVMPVQGANKTILKCVIVNDSNGLGDIINVTIEKYYPDGTLKDIQELHVA
ncbi:MAG: hypothetical protein PHI16_00880, partial [Methanocellales archaeon]|nr:hypothetical protein [Methanocellales archaeon]